MKFPTLIHVVREEADGEPFLVIPSDGAFDAQTFDETRECAVYKKISVGKVIVARKFETTHFHDRKK